MYQKYSRFVVLDIPNFWIFVPLFLGLMNYLSVLWKVLLPIGLHINECPAFCTKQKMFLENLRLNVSDVSENVHNIFTFEEYLNWNWPIFFSKKCTYACSTSYKNCQNCIGTFFNSASSCTNSYTEVVVHNYTIHIYDLKKRNGEKLNSQHKSYTS